MVVITRAAARRVNSSSAFPKRVLDSSTKIPFKKKRSRKTKKNVNAKSSEIISTSSSLSRSSSLTSPLNPKEPDDISPIRSDDLIDPSLYSTFGESSPIEVEVAVEISNLPVAPDASAVNDEEIDGVMRNDILSTNDEFGLDRPEKRSSDLDESQGSDISKDWPIQIDEIQWCKTTRGNDRLCMGGYTYDLMSSSLKNNHRSFRCTKKENGCRAVVYISMDSKVYKGSNQINHNHAPNSNVVKRLLVLEKIKERVLTETTSVTRIIEDEYAKERLSQSEQQHMLLPIAQGQYWMRTKNIID